MEENVLLTPPEFKLYNDRSVYVGTFLGGPLVAGYLAAENFKQLGEQSKVKYAWIIAIAATIIIFGAIFLIPGIENIPRIIVPLIYTLIAQMIVRQYQGAAIKAHIEKGGALYSVWRAVLVGIIGLIVLVAIIFVIVFSTNKEFA